MQWMPLLGHPRAIEYIQERMSIGEKRFAKIYWDTLHKIKNFLTTTHTESELISFLSGIQKELPSNMLDFCEAHEDYHLLGWFPGEKHLIKCEIENKIKWDKIIAIRLDNNDSSYFSDDGTPKENYRKEVSKTDWELELLANIYIDEGRLVGVGFRECRYDQCAPGWAYKLEGLENEAETLYPSTTYYCWTFD